MTSSMGEKVSYWKNKLLELANYDDSNSRKQLVPGDRIAFFERVHSLKMFPWMSNNSNVSPFECAAYGWCAREHGAICVTCSAVLPIEREHSTLTKYEKYCKDLKINIINSHRRSCWWRSHPSPVDSLLMAPYRDQETTCHTLRARFESLTNISDFYLPKLRPYYFYNSLSLLSRHMEIVCQPLGVDVSEGEVDGTPQHTRIVLLLTGWTKSSQQYHSCPVLWCDVCGMSIQLDKFVNVRNNVNGISNGDVHRADKGTVIGVNGHVDMDLKESGCRRGEKRKCDVAADDDVIKIVDEEDACKKKSKYEEGSCSEVVMDVSTAGTSSVSIDVSSAATTQESVGTREIYVGEEPISESKESFHLKPVSDGSHDDENSGQVSVADVITDESGGNNTAAEESSDNTAVAKESGDDTSTAAEESGDNDTTAAEESGDNNTVAEESGDDTSTAAEESGDNDTTAAEESGDNNTVAEKSGDNNTVAEESGDNNTVEEESGDNNTVAEESGDNNTVSEESGDNNTVSEESGDNTVAEESGDNNTAAEESGDNNGVAEEKPGDTKESGEKTKSVMILDPSDSHRSWCVFHPNWWHEDVLFKYREVGEAPHTLIVRKLLLDEDDDGIGDQYHVPSIGKLGKIKNLLKLW